MKNFKFISRTRFKVIVQGKSLHSVSCCYSIAQVIAVLIKALRPMRRRLLQQDRGNTAEADRAQIVNTSPITEAEPTHAQGINCKMTRVTHILLTCRSASTVWVLCLFSGFFSVVDLSVFNFATHYLHKRFLHPSSMCH